MPRGLPGVMPHPRSWLHRVLTLLLGMCVYARTDVTSCVKQCERMAHVCLGVHTVTGSGIDVYQSIYMHVHRCVCGDGPDTHICMYTCAHILDRKALAGPGGAVLHSQQQT